VTKVKDKQTEHHRIIRYSLVHQKIYCIFIAKTASNKIIILQQVQPYLWPFKCLHSQLHRHSNVSTKIMSVQNITNSTVTISKRCINNKSLC